MVFEDERDRLSDVGTGHRDAAGQGEPGVLEAMMPIVEDVGGEQGAAGEIPGRDRGARGEDAPRSGADDLVERGEDTTAAGNSLDPADANRGVDPVAKRRRRAVDVDRPAVRVRARGGERHRKLAIALVEEGRRGLSAKRENQLPESLAHGRVGARAAAFGGDATLTTPDTAPRGVSPRTTARKPRKSSGHFWNAPWARRRRHRATGSSPTGGVESTASAEAGTRSVFAHRTLRMTRSRGEG